jgi:hypothetical protein
MIGLTGIANKWLRRTALTLFCLSSALVASAGMKAHAQNSWQLKISEKELKLAHPNDPMWDKWLMWDIGFQRMLDRNMPYLELMNAATSTSKITEFHITIGDNRFNFGPVEGTNLVMLGSTTPGVNLSASTINSGNELVVNVGNGGLLPGQLVRFKINLDVDPAYAATYQAAFGDSQPDFRTVLFDMNGKNIYDGGTVNKSTADNSQAFVIFTPGGKSSVATFADEDVAAGDIFNNNLREYKAMDAVLIFQLNGEIIPEPASMGLVLIGLSAGLFARRRSRRSLVSI